MSPARASGRVALLLCISVAGLIFIFSLSMRTPMLAASAQKTSVSSSAQPAQADAPATSASASSQNAPEVTSHDTAPTFQVNVRLVEVHVVVRDSNGKAIGTLRKEDFQLFDDRKAQVITKFSVEKPGLEVAREEKTSESPATAALDSAQPKLPERFIAYLFDDVHLAFSDLVQVREAAEKNLDTIQPTDRAAVFTTSGQGNLDFTDDRSKLREAMRHIMPRPISDNSTSQCPKMTYYMADLIQNQNDTQALAAVTADALACEFNNDSRFQSAAQGAATGAAAQGLAIGNAETHLVLSSIKDVVRRLSAVPGQRSIVLVSPGFITPQQQFDVDSVIDRAMHANITINALDARGLYVVMPFGDASQSGPSNPTTAALEAQYATANASADADVLAELADGTGGSFFENSNDLAEGFRRLASAPEYYYVLGFSPQNLKLNGHFHKLKVTLNSPQKFSIQARRGYYAPKEVARPEQVARQEIDDALFSQEEMHDLPVDLHTKFFKATDEQAKLTVLAHIDVKQLHFRKADGRNNSNLTIVSGLFDRNGNLVTGVEKILQMHLKDDTLANRLASGLNVKSDFDVKPGSYLVRLVVRDEQGQIAAENGAIQIP